MSAGAGSGFLVDASGLLLTSSHVVRDARYSAVQIDESSKYPGVVLTRDEDNDLDAPTTALSTCLGTANAGGRYGHAPGS